MKIEKCPFCAGIGTLWSTDQCLTVYAVCKDCGARTANYKLAEQAIAAWNRRAQPENEPLTISELRQMDGEPVYIVTLDNPLENQPYWAIAGINSNDSRYQNGVALYNRVQGDWGAFDLYGDTWLAYRTKPEGSEG